MGMINPHDFPAGAPQPAIGGDVQRRVEAISGRVRIQVGTADGTVDPGPASEQEPAALTRRLVAGMRQQIRTDVGGQPDRAHRRQIASTIIAVPIPPPMQSDAAPRPPPRACSACTSVVSTRAPLAPIG